MWMDSYICPTSKDELTSLLKLQRRMGYTYIGLCVETGLETKEIRELANSLKINIISARVIRADKPGEAKKLLKEKSKAELTIGRPESIEAYRFMSRDSRFKIIEVSPSLIKHIDKGEAGLLTIGGGCLGFDLKLIINKPSNVMVLKAFFSRVFKWGIPFRVYSSATNVFEAWHPKHLYFLAKSMGFQGRMALQGLSPISSSNQIAGGKTND